MTGDEYRKIKQRQRKARQRATARLLNTYSCPVCGKVYDRPGTHIHGDGKQDVVVSFVVTVIV